MIKLHEGGSLPFDELMNTLIQMHGMIFHFTIMIPMKNYSLTWNGENLAKTILLILLTLTYPCMEHSIASLRIIIYTIIVLIIGKISLISCIMECRYSDLKFYETRRKKRRIFLSGRHRKQPSDYASLLSLR